MNDLTQIYDFIDHHSKEIINLANSIYTNPELGYKEFHTKDVLIDFFNKFNIKVNKEFAYTGFSVSIGNTKPHIGLLAELDAVIVKDHPCATNKDHAAHACGHFSQCAIMAASFVALHKYYQTHPLHGSITLFFCPAEEYMDLDYRKELVNQGKIHYVSGKQEMIATHVIDDIDCFIHCHAMGESIYQYNVNSSLAGFIYKTFTFKGNASHAGAAPHLGNNALNMYSLFNHAYSCLRETFKESDLVRFHGYLTKGGDSVNTIPDEVVYQAYLRCGNYSAMTSINDALNNAATCCANALGGTCIINDENGYLPFEQDKPLSNIMYDVLLQFVDKESIGTFEQSIASGDVGDLSCFKPTIQFGYNGFKGRIHGADFDIADTNKAYIEPSKIVSTCVVKLLTNPSLIDNVIKSFEQTLTYDQYMDYLNNKKKTVAK